MNGIMAFIKVNKPLRDAWLKKDREAIFELADWIFKHILVDLRVTHFYFIEPNRDCFLRVHKPDYYGDSIRRSTLDRSIKTKAPASGMELGPLGTLTLRLVHPWRINDRDSGYIELGVEIENMAHRLKGVLGSDLIFTVEKALLDRSRWNAGLKMMGRSGDWDLFSDVVAISQTIKAIPPEVKQFIEIHRGKNAKQILKVAYDFKHYKGGLVPLIDAGNQVIGKIVVLKDITAETELLDTLVIILITSSAVGAALITIFYFFVGGIERRLRASHDELTSEIAERKYAQNALQKAHDKMETRVKEATAELMELNEELHQQVFECESAETALRESEEKYSTLVEDALIGVYIVQDGKIRFANNKFADIFGHMREQIIGIDSLELIHPDDRPAVMEIRENRLAGRDTPSVYEVRGIRKTGETVWLLRSNTLIQYRNSPAIAGNIADITQRKEAEANLRQSEKEHRILSGRLLSAEENERKKIAREVHDSIGQALSAIKYSLENAISKYRGRISASEIKHLEAIVPITQQSIEEVRRITMDLRPSILDDLGILATINWFCREFEEIYHGITIKKEIALKEDVIPPSIKTAIYRVVQEALNNIAKHSQADLVRIQLKKVRNRIDLEILDNGIGLDMEALLAMPSPEGGFGLASMKERAKLSGGTFQLNASPEEGTRIHISWQ